ncbi:hypothetical protein [Methylobacterium sp. A54F]
MPRHTSRTTLRPTLRPRAGGPVTALFLAGLALSGAAALLVAPPGLEPAAAQSVANPNDQPTAGTLPSGTSTVKGDPARDRPTAGVSAPSTLKPGTRVIQDGGNGGRTNPEEHLPGSMRRGG